MTESDIPWRVSDCVEWIYERKEGDITVYARTVEEVILCIREHGFTVTDASKIRRGKNELADILQPIDVK